MSITSFSEIHDGRSGGEQLTGSKVVRIYTRTFRAITDDNTDDASDILDYASCPRVGNQHPNDSTAYCRSVTPRNETFSKRVWKVDAQYSNERELSDNPLNDPAVITWGTELFQRPYVKDKDGLGVVNPVGMFWDPPPEGDDANWVVNVKTNQSSIPTWILGYRNAINVSTFFVDGVGIAARAAKLQGITIGEWQERNDIYFRQLDMAIHLRASWKLEVLNDGFTCDDGTGSLIDCVDDAGEKTTVPWPLNANGTRIAAPTPANVTYSSFSIYNEVDFNLLPLT